MPHPADNLPPDPNWFLVGCLLLFLAQLAIYAALIIQIVRDHLGFI